MSVMEAIGRLERSQKELNGAWRRANELWRDNRARNLEERLLDPLADANKQAIESVARLAQAVQQVKRACSD